MLYLTAVGGKRGVTGGVGGVACWQKPPGGLLCGVGAFDGLLPQGLALASREEKSRGVPSERWTCGASMTSADSPA
eukprot:CAMPEP_0174754098 /NCGR_PEP_ID=MMETSP1094-20130205/105357_1 /TAXON_ID=156173 /ORGANISM="Chrysochromulina brevifilum, Strain UTEX LB 985" /LENGTH=75 /DNA_ID=CAMNT_0015959939 /DNA_START=320 /DNA_END=545 /DNA_ORIENTATION=-